MTTVIKTSSGTFVNTTVLLPKDIKDEARSRKIPFSRTLLEGLKKKLEDLETGADQSIPSPVPTNGSSEGD